MTVLVTGAAGFIGFHTCRQLLARGERVIGVDDLNGYYDVALKRARLHGLDEFSAFSFVEASIADRAAMEDLARRHPGIDRIVNLAAQPGVRYSLINPHAYVQANVDGFLMVLELARGLAGCRHLVYASSSSVYGHNRKTPFAETDPVDHPVSLYAATKKAGELFAHCYSHLYRIPATGLRFFTVYGPWGRPDMAPWLFTRAMLAGEPITVFNHGDLRRDFTYIDDIVDGVLRVLDHPPADSGNEPPQRLYNIGNHRAEPLLRFIAVLEQATGRKAALRLAPMQPGDVYETCADVSALERDLGWRPRTSIDEGLPRFVEWFRAYHRL